MSAEKAMRMQVGGPFWIVDIRGGIKQLAGFEWGLQSLVNVQK